MFLFNLIRLYLFFCFLQLWYGPCSFSNILFYEKRNFCVFFDHMIIFPYFFESKKTRIEILRRSVKCSARELRSETISCIFGWCRYQNNPRLSWSLQNVFDIVKMYQMWFQQSANISFLVKHIFEKLHGPYQNWKKGIHPI